MKIFKVSSIVFSSLVNGSSSEFQRDESEAANQLIDTLHFLSPMSSAFKFDQYGCHCFQRGLESSAFTGKGPALDDMDRACLKFHQCQRCLGIDKGKECNHLSTYDIRLVEDSVTSHRTAVCQDEPGSCGRNLCECSVAFAKAMREAEETSPWNIEISKYSADQTFRAQCHGHGASGAAHAAHTTTTTVSNEMEIDPTVQTTTTTQMSPINVRARFMDMPDVNLKFGVNDSENESITISSTVSASKMDTNTGKMYSSKTVFDDPEETTISTSTAADENSSLQRYPISVQTEVQSQTQTRQTETSLISQSTVNQMIAGRTDTQVVQQPTVAYEEPREMCCGEYSDHRFPYFSLNRGCCNGKTFDTINLQCCDGVIKSKFSKC